MDKDIRCHKCNQYFLTHEEKRTDVNIAPKLFGDAFEDLYDNRLNLHNQTKCSKVADKILRLLNRKEILS